MSMYAKKYNETPNFNMFGNKYNMLLPRDMTESTEVGLVRMEKGSSTPAHAHPEEEQIYFILSGKGLLKIDKEEKEIGEGMIVYIPRNKQHEVLCTGTNGLAYIYVAIWPEGIPVEQKDWKKAYKLK